MRVALDQSQIDQVAIAIETLSNAAGNVRGTVSSVHATTDNLDRGIATVKSEFDAYREYDTYQKNLINAKSEIVKVRMELDEKFGINKEIRRYLTGILEASDLSIVKKEVVSNCTEKMMMDCKEYWLAPCLVALAAWLGDNKPLADRALTEALKRNDEQTSLLFALVCRRVGRPNASIQWLERYFSMQNPHEVERKMVTVLDAYSNGLFGQQAKDLCEEKIDAWIREMTDEPGFVEAQQLQWETSIRSKIEKRSHAADYPYASKYSTNWADCENSLNETSLHQTMLDYFKGIFEKTTHASIALNDRLDQLLENYISSYDDAELPLRRKERELELIIEERGNIARATTRLEAEQKSMDEVLDFTQLLTSAAMHADVIKASNATQRLAIALSKEWVINAYENIILSIRQRFVERFDLNIEGWTGITHDGSEEKMLSSSVETHFSQIRDQEIATVQQNKLDMILPIVCVVLSLFSFISRSSTWGIMLLISSAGLGLRWFMNKRNVEEKQRKIRERYDEIIKDVKSIIYAVCAEKVDYDRQILAQDTVSEETLEYLKSIEAVQYVKRAEGRAIS